MQLKNENEMKTYSLPKSELTTGKRIRRELAVLLYLQLILLFLFGLNLTFEITLYLVYFLLLSLRQRRILYKISINQDSKQVEIDYYFMVFFPKKLFIPFTDLKTRKLHKRQGLGNACETMEFIQGKQLEGEIRLGGHWKWDESTFKEIYQELEAVQSIQ
jgi:hypothetical protein